MKPGPDVTNASVDPGRRALLRAATLALLGMLGGACGRIATHESSALPDWLSAVLNDPQAAADIGNAYLAQTPGERRIELLLELIVAALVPRLGRAPESLVPQHVAGILREVVRDDYARGEVVRVDGWLLSLTEARLYAAVALV